MVVAFDHQSLGRLAFLARKYISTRSDLFRSHDPHEASHRLAYDRRTVFYRYRTGAMHSRASHTENCRLLSDRAFRLVQTELYLRSSSVVAHPWRLAPREILDCDCPAGPLLCALFDFNRCAQRCLCTTELAYRTAISRCHTLCKHLGRAGDRYRNLIVKTESLPATGKHKQAASHRDVLLAAASCRRGGPLVRSLNYRFLFLVWFVMRRRDSFADHCLRA